MKLPRVQLLTLFVSLSVVPVFSPAIVIAIDGIWKTTPPGAFNWGDAANWSNGTIASGAGSTASFSIGNPTGDITVNLDTPRTVGTVNFGDSDNSSTAGWTVSGPNALTLDNTGGIGGAVINVGSLATGKSTNISAPLIAPAGFTKLGTDELTLSGATTIGGPIVLDGGGSLTFASNNSIQDLVIGATPSGGVGSGFSHVVNVNGNVTATSFTAQTNSTNIVNIATGKTLTINGPMTVGFDTSPSTVAPVFSVYFIGGSLAVGNPGAILTVGSNVSTGTTVDTAVLDVHNLSSFSFNGGATGEVRIGGGNLTNTGNRANGTLILSNTANTINAGSVVVGGGADASGTAGAALVLLGNGTNVLDVDKLFISTWKTNGTMSFIGATGSLKIRDRTDTGRAAVTLGSSEGITGNTGSHTGTLTTFSHGLDMLASTLTLGNHSAGTGATNSIGVLNFDSGVVDTTSLVMATNSTNNAGAGSGQGNGTITLGGSTVSSTATAMLKVGSGGFTLANVGFTGGAGTGTLNIRSGGVVQTASDIQILSGTGTINLTGGTLDMQGHKIIVGASSPGNTTAGTLNLTSASGSSTIKDLALIDLNGTPGGITKGGAGRLTIAGNNAYAGDTTIGATNISGTVSITGTTLPAGKVVINTGTLAGTGSVGDVVLNTTGPTRIAPGATELDGQTGNLTMAGLIVNGGELRFDLSTPAGTNDKITVGADGANFSSPSNITIGAAPMQAGNYTLLQVGGAGTLTGTVPTVVTNLPDTSTRAKLTASFSGNSLVLNATADAKSLTWTGGADGTTWDLADTGSAATGTQNWSNNGTQVANDKFFHYDTVTFGPDTDKDKRTINITSAMQPRSVIVNNTSGAGFDYTFTGTGGIAGSASLTKSGTGTLIVGTLNTYTGPTSVTAGKLTIAGTGDIATTSGISVASGATLQVGNADTTITINGHGLGTAPIANNGTIAFNTAAGTRAAPVNIPSSISGSGTIEMNGTGVVRLSGTNFYTGTTSVNSGVLQINTISSVGGPDAGPINVASGATLEFSGGGNNALLLGNRPITIAGTGVGDAGALIMGVSLQQQNAFSNIILSADASIASGGRTEIKYGTLNLNGHKLTNLSGQFALTSTTVTDGDILIAAGQCTFQDITLRGTGTLTINGGVNTRFAGTAPGTITRPIVIAGNLIFFGQNNNNPPANTPGGICIPSTIDSPITLQGNLSVQANTVGPTNTIVLNGNISEDATPRSLTLNANNVALLVLGGNNTFTGGVTINGNVLQLNSTGSMNTSKPNPLTFGNSAPATAGLRLNGNSVAIGGLNGGSGSPFVENGSATPVTVTVSNTAADTFIGNIRDGNNSAPLSLGKSGSGSLTLTGISTYTGPTRVNQGILALGGQNFIAGPSASNLIMGGGTFATGGFPQVMGTLQVTGNSGIDMGGAFCVLQLAPSSAVPWASDATLSVVNWSGSANTGGGADQVFVGNSGTGLTASQLSQVHFQGFNGAKILSNGEVVPLTVSTRLLGDFTLNSHVDAADIPVMINALKDLNAFKASSSLTADDLLNIGDLDLSGSITNSDLQGLIDYLKAGKGSTSAVPEPAAWLMMALGLTSLAAVRYRRNRSTR